SGPFAFRAGAMVKVRLVPLVLPPNVRPLFGTMLVSLEVAVNVRLERAVSASFTKTLIVVGVSSGVVTGGMFVIKTVGLIKKLRVHEPSEPAVTSVSSTM